MSNVDRKFVRHSTIAWLAINLSNWYATRMERLATWACYQANRARRCSECGRVVVTVFGYTAACTHHN